MNPVRHPSTNQASVTFNWDANVKRKVVINDPDDDFVMESICVEDEPNYRTLWTNKEAMSTYLNGYIFPDHEVHEVVQTWSERYLRGDPYSAFAIRIKKTNEFVGNALLGHGSEDENTDIDAPGVSEISGVSLPQFWNRGYGKKAAENLINVYAPELIKKGYLRDGETLKKIYAWVMPSNTFSKKILSDLGMTKEKEAFHKEYDLFMEKYSMSTQSLQ
jgi:RimJ/RimL family protein N-acetyltransferase